MDEASAPELTPCRGTLHVNNFPNFHLQTRELLDSTSRLFRSNVALELGHLVLACSSGVMVTSRNAHRLKIFAASLRFGAALGVFAGVKPVIHVDVHDAFRHNPPS